MADDAPLFNDVARGPDGGRAVWVRTADGVRLRVAHWPGSRRGTVFLFPGRTEYVEKYGIIAAGLTARGFDVLSIDWRGQGLADRLLDDPMIGHVGRFLDFQLDVDAMLALAHEVGVPEPYHLVAHSMGGCIGLRSLHRNLPFDAVVFTGPMWGIAAKPHLRLASWTISTLAHAVGHATGRVPSTAATSYVLSDAYEDNMLTTDRDMWDYMVEHMHKIDGIGLAGPSLNWLYEALRETHDLRRLGPAEQPCLTIVGGNERIVDVRAIRSVMGRWDNGRLVVQPGLEHEIMMEGPAVRERFFDEADALFGKRTG